MEEDLISSFFVVLEVKQVLLVATVNSSLFFHVLISYPPPSASLREHISRASMKTHVQPKYCNHVQNCDFRLQTSHCVRASRRCRPTSIYYLQKRREDEASMESPNRHEMEQPSARSAKRRTLRSAYVDRDRYRRRRN